MYMITQHNRLNNILNYNEFKHFCHLNQLDYRIVVTHLAVNEFCYTNKGVIFKGEQHD
jgi:hypothetical protein